MLKLLYKPVAIVAGIVSGLLSGLIFKRVWKIVGRGSDAPAPMDSERGWGRSCWPQACMARYTRWSRRPSTAAPPSGRARKPESGQAVPFSNLTSRLTTAGLKPPSMRPSDRAEAGHRQRGHERPVTGSMNTGSGMTPEALTEPVNPGVWERSGWRRSGRVHRDGAPAGKGAAGVPGQLGDDGGARAPRCSPSDRRRHVGPGLRHVIRGPRVTTIIRNRALHLSGPAGGS